MSHTVGGAVEINTGNEQVDVDRQGITGKVRTDIFNAQ
jgi:hypothetical protein